MVAGLILTDDADFRMGHWIPRSRKVAIDGHSKIEINNRGTTNFHRSTGFMTWARFLSGQRVDFKPEWNFGVGGQTSKEILARLPATLAACKAAGIGMLVAQMTINDRVSTPLIRAPETIANVAAYQAAVLAAGIVLVWLTDDPRGAAGFTAARISQPALGDSYAVREYLLNQKDVPGVYVIDTHEVLASKTSTTGDLAADFYTYDGNHDSPQEGRLKGEILARLFSRVYPPRSVLPTSNSDIYSSSNNPRGIRSTNPWASGTAGTLGSGNSGTLPDSWTGQSVTSAGLALTFSKPSATTSFNSIPYEDGFTRDNWVQMVLSGTAANSNNSNVLQIPVDQTKVNPGDVISAFAEIEIDSMTGLRGFNMFLWDTTSNTRVAGDFENFDADTPNQAVPWLNKPARGIMKTTDLVVANTTLQIRFLVAPITGGGAVSMTVRMRGVGAIN
jgi:hypothetical protein